MTGRLVSICQGHFMPVCSGMLLGLVAVPALAASTSQPAADAAQPRLRLATVLASLHRHGDTERRVKDETASESAYVPAATEPPLLPLNWAYQLSGLISAQPSPSRRDSSAGGNSSTSVEPAGQPNPDDTPRGSEPPPIPARRSTVSKSEPRETLVDSSSRRGQTTGASEKTAAPLSAVSADRITSPQTARADAKVVGEGEFLPAEELEVDSTVSDLPLPSSGKGSSPSTSLSRSQKRWGLAPIRWGGTVLAGMRRNSSETSSGSTSQVYEGRLRANSYIWRPYFALVSGDFALTTTRTQDSGDVSSSNLVGTSVTGGGTISLFPQSRFPFSASLSRSDSRSEGSFSDSNVEQTRLSLRQDYRPQRGQWTASGGYDRSELSGTFGSDIVDRVFSSFSNSRDRHSFNVAGDFSRSQAAEQSGNSYFVGLGHNFAYSSELSLSTNANITGQQFDLAEDSARTRSLQVFSYGNWSPVESKLRGSASLRYFQTNNTVGGTDFTNRSVGGVASLNYQASRNLGFFGTVGWTLDNDNNLASNQTLGVTYSGDPLQFGNYDYNWFTSGSVSNATSGEGDSFRAVSSSVGHALMRSWQTSEQTRLSGSLNQSMSTSRSTGVGSSSATTLSHSASLSMQANAGETLVGYLSANASDSRSMGDTTSSFQMLNVQLTGNWRINQYSELDSNLTWQWVRQESEGEQSVVLIDELGRPVFRDDTSRTGNTSLSGGMGYSHRRVFGLRGLRYRLDFRANTSRDDSRRFGNPNAQRQQDRATLDLDQRLLYRIGRLDTQLQYRVAQVAGQRNQLIYFLVSRDFGSF